MSPAVEKTRSILAEDGGRNPIHEISKLLWAWLVDGRSRDIGPIQSILDLTIPK